MPILKPIDGTYICPTDLTLDSLLATAFDFNGMIYIETDIAGSQLQNLDPYSFFAVNRVINMQPISSTNRYSQANYNCLLTIAQPADASLEVETINVDGQFATITEKLMTLEFLNTLRSYVKCCGAPMSITTVTPIYNSNRAVPAVNHSGIEINYQITI